MRPFSPRQGRRALYKLTHLRKWALQVTRSAPRPPCARTTRIPAPSIPWDRPEGPPGARKPPCPGEAHVHAPFQAPSPWSRWMTALCPTFTSRSVFMPPPYAFSGRFFLLPERPVTAHGSHPVWPRIVSLSLPYTMMRIAISWSRATRLSFTDRITLPHSGYRPHFSPSGPDFAWRTSSRP